MLTCGARLLGTQSSLSPWGPALVPLPRPRPIWAGVEPGRPGKWEEPRGIEFWDLGGRRPAKQCPGDLGTSRLTVQLDRG